MSITKHSVSILSVALTIAAMVTFAFAFAPQAQAADFDMGVWGDYYPEVGGGAVWGDYYPEVGGGAVWGDYYPESGAVYGDYYPSYGGGYSYPAYSSYGGGYGGWSMPFATMGGGGMSQSQSSTNVNTNTNSCTAGSCNTNINAPTNIVTSNPAPTQTVVYATPSYPTYPTYPVYPPVMPTIDICPNLFGTQSTLPAGYYIQNGNCFWYQTQSQPYVTLSQVPYTGYEMGPVGTALYWSFLVLWCLIAAYLIVVKKVQNKIAAWFTGSAPRTHVAASAHTAHATAPAPASSQFDGIDPFIASQIARVK